jgi:hypothetical protein
MAVFRSWFLKELAMVIPIDAVRYGAGFDANGQWHEAEADYVPTLAEEVQQEVMAPARGAAYGILVSGILWVGLVAAVRGALTLMR